MIASRPGTDRTAWVVNRKFRLDVLEIDSLQLQPAFVRMKKFTACLLLALSAVALAACGGGGGGSSNPRPGITFSGSLASVEAGGSLTLTWTVTDANACTASGGWSGSRATSGSEQVGPIAADTNFGLECSNGNGSTSRSVSVDVIPRPAPAIQISANPALISPGGSSTISWTTQNATTCSATGAIAGSQPTSGSVVVGPLTTAANVSLTCVGNGKQSLGQAVVGLVGSGKVAVSGRVTFDRVPFKAVSGTGLDPNAAIQSPSREVVIEAIGSGASVVATTLTDHLGNYTLELPQNAIVRVRAKAQMLKTTSPTWDFKVLNNRNANALYVLDGTDFNTGTTNISGKNLHASSGWSAVAYTGTRAAAPFAILDTIYKAKELVRTGNPSASFPELAAYWSEDNRPSNTFCPSEGNIVSSLYIAFATNGVDECAAPLPGSTGIYILGNYQIGDTDEFDEHVIAHEFGHYFEDRFSRSDSIGGSHGSGERLDPRVAFGEGWGNAFGAMALNNPSYRDSSSGMTQDAGFNIESSSVVNPGWFSEFAVHKFLWDLFDGGSEPGDDVSLGFVSIYNVMTMMQPQTDALTSIFPFVRSLKQEDPSVSSGINDLLSQYSINSISDDFGTSETAFSGGQNVVPIYTNINPGTPVSLCGTTAYGGEYNKLSNRRFLRFQSASARTITLTVAATSGTGADPDVVVWKQGNLVDFGEEVGGTEVLQVPVQAGTYVIEIYDYNHVDLDNGTGSATTCMNVSIAG